MRVAFYTLGCKLNQAETESLLHQFREAGFELVAPDDVADIYIANTCTVTHIADRKSRHWLRLARRRNPEALIIAAGCYARRAPQELGELADIVFDNEGKEHLPGIVKGLLWPTCNLVISSRKQCHREPELRAERGGSEASWKLQAKQFHLTNGSTRVRSLVKIQDGCHSPCTYCIVPQVRSREYSVPASQIVEEIRQKVAKGYKEVILTGTKIGSYEDGNTDLRGLVEKILSDTDIKRLRLSSLQPQEISPEFLALWQDYILNPSPERSEGTCEESGRICCHFHLALQSGSDTVLQRMKRGYSLDNYRTAMNLIKETIPEAAITTDIIVGFPGESDEEFEQSHRFCHEAGFANIHVFPFSPRPGTRAAKMPNQVKDKVKKERSEKMLELAQNCRHSFCERFLGQIRHVLWEKETAFGDGVYSGLTDNYIRVFTQSEKPLANRITAVKLLRFHDQGMWGELINENSG